jgi:acetyltransferase-like isoleucine patch superfamily enzyme
MLRFIFGKYIIMLTSYFIKVILVLGGMKIGKGFRVDGFPRIIGKKTNITIGDNVSIMKGVELKTRGGGEIQILNNVKIDNGVRIIAANNATVKINNFAKIMFNSNINAGADITIGTKSGISAFCMVNSSLHRVEKDDNFMDQGYDHMAIVIGDDVQIGSHSYIMPGVKISNKAMISTHSVIQNDIPEYAIVAGIPARVVGSRK